MDKGICKLIHVKLFVTYALEQKSYHNDWCQNDKSQSGCLSYWQGIWGSLTQYLGLIDTVSGAHDMTDKTVTGYCQLGIFSCQSMTHYSTTHLMDEEYTWFVLCCGWLRGRLCCGWLRGRVMHMYVSKLTIIVSDNGLAPSWRQGIIWTNAGILSIGPLGTNFSEILFEFTHFH